MQMILTGHLPKSNLISVNTNRQLYATLYTILVEDGLTIQFEMEFTLNQHIFTGMVQCDGTQQVRPMKHTETTQ